MMQQCCAPNQNNKENEEKEEENQDCYKETYEKYEDIISALPKEKGWRTEHLLQYQGTWMTSTALKGAMLVQQHFKAQPSDVILATNPKSGTTWFKALIFALKNRAHFESMHALLTTSPHDCIPFMELLNLDQNLNLLPSPRLLATHIPYPLLPNSVASSGCHIVYIWRDPKDVLVSKWQFFSKNRQKQLSDLSLEEAFELFCRGVSTYGPFWDHVLGYWKASLELPENVLFLSYEDMKKEPLASVKRLAEFLGQPFSLEEEGKGVVQEILKLCSFENLSNLEVNKNGVKQFGQIGTIENRDFFRKGQIGDWENYLTTEMKEHLDQITKQKFEGSGLTFHVAP